MCGIEPRLCVEEEDLVVGAVIGHRSGLTLGWYVEARDLDGLIIQLHTIGQPAADEA